MLFSSLFFPDRVREAVGDRAWVAAMLEVEGALARAEASLGLIPAQAADAITTSCAVEKFDIDRILRDGRDVGNPAEPLVRALRRVVPDGAAGYVHLGATSQDLLDTASMLVTRRSLAVLDADLTTICSTLAWTTEEHRHTLMAGRTLLQQAVPITFGLKAAGWLSGAMRSRAEIRCLTRDGVLAAQLGGAAGTLASLGDSGIAVLHAFAQELDLSEPVLPWHAERTRIAEIGGVLTLTAGTLDKIALDIILMAQTEVGEVAESGEGRRGGSSTMPHKHNPVGSVLVRACARGAQSGAATLLASMAQEHERGAGSWQAEWPALSSALAGTAGAAAWLRGVLESLQIRPEHMRRNLDATGGAIMSEALSTLLSERVGREEAHNHMRALGERAAHEGTGMTELLRTDETIRLRLSPEEMERATQPEHYLGSTDAFIDRTLAEYRSQDE